MRVLIVDDDPFVSRVFARLLKKRGADVDQAMRADVARFMLESSLDPDAAYPYDVVLSDVDMPGGDGFSLVAWMQEREYPAKAVLMSADSYSPDRREKAEKLGVELLDKAREQDQILAEVSKLAAIRVCW
jgi:CheY-like chemotaxis protein